MKRYELCPKCELNYIDPQKQNVCDVCKKQMLGLYSPEEDFPTEEEFEDDYLHSPFLQKTERSDRYEKENEEQDDDAWREFVDSDPIDERESVLEDLPEPDEDEEEEEFSETDDFEYVSADDYLPEEDEEEEEDGEE